MIDIRRLDDISPEDLHRLIAGYDSDACYHPGIRESPEEVVLRLELVALPHPYRKRFDPPDAATVARYREITALGFSFGAYSGGEIVGLAIAEPQRWNKGLSILEFHIDPRYHRRGLGMRLMDAITEHARDAGFRILVCETQNTNMPAIRFYRRAGFAIEGIDLSLYSNDDISSGEIAIFMKKRLSPAANIPAMREER